MKKGNQSEIDHKTVLSLLQLLSERSNLHQLMKSVVQFLQIWSGCEAVGIRLKEGLDFPYFETHGFTGDFIEKENWLCVKDINEEIKRDEIGHPFLECMCGNILCGRFDSSKPFFTSHGSFWSNCTTELLAITSEADRQARTRNRCNGEGYESVALIPLRMGDETFGLIQLNDKKKECFTLAFIEQMEQLADSIAIALAQRKSDKALHESEERYRSLFDNMLEGYAYCKMLYKDDKPIDFIYINVNKAFETLTGLKDVEGKKVSEVIPGIRETDSALFDLYSRVAKSGSPIKFETFVHALKIWFSISVFSPKKDHFVAVFDVITKRKQTEEQLIKAKEKAEESDRLKTAFLYNMSHEIRTPMNAIIGFADFLSRPGVTEPKKSHFTSLIQQRSYDLLRIIEDILDISRLEVGQMSIIESEFILSDLMKELLEYYKLKKTKTEANSSISLQLSLDESLKGISISADQFRLKQILNNLLDNAFKFTQHGLIEFGCKLMVNANDASLQFFVKDTGIGIPANKFDLIFDRFCQADDSLIARKYGGTGLGLSIVKGMVKLMNGKIWLESRENSGTTFYFTLPLIQTTSKEEPNTEVKNSQNIWWENKTVLLVEDDESNTIYLTEVLAQKGLTLLNAYTGKDALQIFKNNPNIDLILMDIRLPDINGLIVTRKIKKKNPDVVIIAQTAYATPKDIKDCLKAGCNDYLSKPIMYEKMILLLDQYLRKK